MFLAGQWLEPDLNRYDSEHAASARLLKILQRREQALAVERKEAPSRLAELASQDQAHRLLLVRNTARFSTWGVTEQLIDELWPSDR